jgi:hypothetical protein
LLGHLEAICQKPGRDDLLVIFSPFFTTFDAEKGGNFTTQNL